MVLNNAVRNFRGLSPAICLLGVVVQRPKPIIIKAGPLTGLRRKILIMIKEQ